jgi:protein SCO1/2
MQAVRVALLTGYLGMTLATMALPKSEAPFKILPSEDQPQSRRIMRPRSVPEFVLTERSGRKTSLTDLRGKIWIADFIYTRCTDTCPLQTADMAKLQQRWINERDLMLVSFSVDPERDTPPVLSRYAARFKADAQRWLFLTGDKDQIARLVEGGFHLPASAAISRHNGTPIVLHSPQFILVDRQAQIRGSYDSRDEQSMRRLETDVAKLLSGSTDVAKKKAIGKSDGFQ